MICWLLCKIFHPFKLKTKLIILFNRLSIGGQAFDTLPQAYYLRNDFDVLVLVGEKEPDEEDAVFLLDKYPGINIKKISSLKRSISPLTDIAAFFKIRREIKGFKCSIIHTHGFKPGLMGRLAGYFCRVPCIIHTYHGHHFHSYYNKFISAFIIKFERLLCRMNTKVVAISNRQKNELVHTYAIVPENKTAVIHLGIDREFFSENTAEKRKIFRDTYALDEDTVAICIVGRIVPIKNHTLFVNVAARLLSSSKKKLRFFVIGDGDLKISVQHQFENKGIAWCSTENFNKESPVIFTSWIAEISTAMPGLDIVALTSHNEGTPMSLIEAQLCGKPVVATDVGGVRDTFINNETGFSVPAGDENFFSEKLELLISDKSLRETMGNKGADFAGGQFSKTEEIKNLLALYKSCPLKK